MISPHELHEKSYIGTIISFQHNPFLYVADGRIDLQTHEGIQHGIIGRIVSFGWTVLLHVRGCLERHLSLPGYEMSFPCVWTPRVDSEFDVTWRLAGTTTRPATRHLPLTLAGLTGGHHPHSDEHDDPIGREESRALHHWSYITSSEDATHGLCAFRQWRHKEERMSELIAL